MIVSACLTERCNLSCDYCYSRKDWGIDMSAQTAAEIVDYALSATPPGDVLELGFFGGEPFLCLELMRETAAYARACARSAKIPLRLRVTSNGTLLDDDALAFLEESSVDLCVSVDGAPAVHDQQRRFEDGSGSAEVVADALLRVLARLDRLQVNAVYGPATVESLPGTVAFLAELGVQLIHLNLNITSPWPAPAYAGLREIYSDVADLVVDYYRTGRPLAVNLIDNKVILFLKDGFGDEDRCGMGKKKVGFAPNGDMYPCERLIGHGAGADLCMGNLCTGLEPERLAAVQARTGNRNPECRACPAERFCMNWCGCTNYHMTGHTDVVSPVLCASEKAAIAAAQRALAALSDNDLFIGHLMSYLRDRRSTRRETGDDGLEREGDRWRSAGRDARRA